MLDKGEYELHFTEDDDVGALAGVTDAGEIVAWPLDDLFKKELLVSPRGELFVRMKDSQEEATQWRTYSFISRVLLGGVFKFKV